MPVSEEVLTGLVGQVVEDIKALEKVLKDLSQHVTGLQTRVARHQAEQEAK